jgi:hypothetical protein
MIAMARRATPLQAISALTARIEALTHQRDTRIAEAITAGNTWAEIARALGVTTQAAHKRYRRLRQPPATGETWQEPPLPI